MMCVLCGVCVIYAVCASTPWQVVVGGLVPCNEEHCVQLAAPHCGCHGGLRGELVTTAAALDPGPCAGAAHLSTFAERGERSLCYTMCVMVCTLCCMCTMHFVCLCALHSTCCGYSMLSSGHGDASAAGGGLEPPDRHGAHPFLATPLAATAAGPARATVPPHPQQAGPCTAALAPQRRLRSPHPAALEGCVHPRGLGGLHAQEHRAKAG